MTAAMENRPPGKVPAFLAGLQGGMMGVLWMLVWLGLSARWQNRSFWTAERMLASVVYKDAVASALPGLALYILVYTLLGGLFAAVFQGQARQVRILLLSLAFSLGWYYFSFHLLYRSVLPLMVLLHSERSMLLGHLVYGTLLSRFQNYLKG